MESVGLNIRRLRQEKGLTIKELGNLCGISEPNMGNYERGVRNPKLETLKKIAKALQVDYSDLLATNVEHEKFLDNFKELDHDTILDCLNLIDIGAFESFNKNREAFFNAMNDDYLIDDALSYISKGFKKLYSINMNYVDYNLSELEKNAYMIKANLLSLKKSMKELYKNILILDDKEFYDIIINYKNNHDYKKEILLRAYDNDYISQCSSAKIVEMYELYFIKLKKNVFRIQIDLTE
ncbi:helix-turn-helix domain-containing protein [Thomasclavelia cocleata]|uniref:helix-turn-helix domain-containing protein n=2 Tax=Thomasclavelia cocleata TaxID=69824 RepID=UPI00255823BA|nr:helix-turn-helix transcriptional regulator [Thomasclavelia cocleata]